MPKFIDYHKQLPTLPPEVVQQMQADIKAGKSDQFGVKAINLKGPGALRRYLHQTWVGTGPQPFHREVMPRERCSEGAA